MAQAVNEIAHKIFAIDLINDCMGKYHNSSGAYGKHARLNERHNNSDAPLAYINIALL